MSIFIDTFKKQGRVLFTHHVVLSILEVVSIGSIFPILFVVVDPEVVTRQSKTKYIYDMLGFTHHATFFVALIVFFAVAIIILYAYKLWLHRQTFSFFVHVQRHVERLRYSLLLQSSPEPVSSIHPAQESRKQFFLAQRYVNYLNYCLSIVKAGSSLFLIFIVLAWYDWEPVVSIVVGGVFYYAIILRFFQRKSTNLDEEEITQTGGLIQFWQESIQSQYHFLLGVSPHKNLRLFSLLQDKIQGVRYRRDIYGFLPRMLIEVSFVIGVLGFLLYAFVIGQIGFVPYLALFGVAGLRSLISLDGIYRGVMGLAIVGDIRKQVVDCIEEVDSHTEVHVSNKPFHTLDLKDMDFSYPSTQAKLFSSAEISITQGESICILGKSGIGKTTLLELILGFRPLQKGEYRLNGVVSKSGMYQLIKVGYVSQSGPLITGSIEDNIALGVESGEIDHDLFLEVCRLTCIDEFIGDMNNGYQTRIGHQGVRLSAGQQRRVLLARELYRKPEVLCLDEVTNGLDGEVTERIVGNLLSLGITIVFTTHKEWLTSYFDKVYRVEGGNIILQKP